MKVTTLLIFVVTFFSDICNGQSRHILLISIDGFRSDFYRDPEWPAPNLKLLIEKGSYSIGMRSVFPSYTYPAHAAMVTGALPRQSGIFYNVQFNSQNWNWFTKNIKVNTLWQACQAKRLTTAAIQWPISIGNEITYNIPEIWDTLHPADRITTTRKYATKGLIEEIEKYATGKLDRSNMNEEAMGLDDNAGRMAAYIYKKYRPNLLAVHFAGVDGRQHEHGRDHEEVRLALANVDHAIGVILEAVEASGLNDSTTILIVGDHGFTNVHGIVRPNAWLNEKGLLDRARFQPAGGSAFLYLNQKNDSATVKAVTRILENRDEQQYFSIYDRKKLDKLGADSNAVLALAAKPGYVFSGGTNPLSAFHTSGGHHGYDPNLPEMMTGFIAAGAGINKGVILENMCVTDIAPIVAALLSIPFNAPDGKVPVGLLKNKKE